MNIKVLKFGGSVISSVDDIREVALRIKERFERGDFPVVVVSAIRGMTDELISMAYRLSKSPARREMDMLISVGERISMSLLAIALNDMGLKARSYTGSQVGIITENRHTSARVYEVRLYRILDSIERGEIPIVAGFQGVSLEKEITTLGRGGSDLTAVALTVALRKHFSNVDVEFYKNVDGVYSVNPSIAPSRRIPLMSYEEMIVMSSMGAKIVHSRAASLAARYNIPLTIRGFRGEEGGTIVKDIEFLEGPHVKAIVDVPAVSVYLQVERMDRVPQIITALSSRGISPVMFYHTYVGDKPHLAFVLKESDYGDFRSVVKDYPIEHREVHGDKVLVTVVGYGAGNSKEVKDAIISTADRMGIHIDAFISDDYRVSILVDSKNRDIFVKELARIFHLLSDQ